MSTLLALALLLVPGPPENCEHAAGPEGPCVHASAEAQLEEPGAKHLALLVDLPGSPGRRGLFVYRPEGARLVPRFLGSGFQGLSLTGVAAGEPGTLVVGVVAADGAARSLRCRFVEFPLVCEEAP